MSTPWAKYQSEGDAKPWEKYGKTSEALTDARTYEDAISGLGRGTLKAFPVAGGLLAGGAAAMNPLTAPFATQVGLLGAAGGKVLQNIGEKYIYDDPISRSDVYVGPVISAAEQGAGDLSARAVGNAFQSVVGLLKTGKKPMVQSITEASGRLGFKPTPGMLTDSRIVGGLESSLEQSPSLGGALMRKEIQPVREGLQSAAESVVPEASIARSAIGSDVKSGLTKKLTDRAENAGSYFEDIRGSTKFMDIPDKSRSVVLNNLDKIDGASLGGDTTAALGKWKTMISNAKDVNELKLIGTEAGRIAGDFTKSSIERSVAGEVIDKVRRLEQSTILRRSVETAMNNPEGKQIAKDLIMDLKEGRKLYAELMGDVKSIGQGSGIGKTKSLGQFKAKLNDIPDEKIVDKFFRPDNYAYLSKLKTVAPEEFEAMRGAYLDGIRAKSLSSKSGDLVSPRKLLNNIESMEERTRNLVFGEDATQTLKDLKTVVNSLPDKAGPSGTPMGIELKDLNIVNLPMAILNQAGRLSQYGLLKGLSVPGKVISSPNSRPLVEMTSRGLIRPDLQQSKRRD